MSLRARQNGGGKVRQGGGGGRGNGNGSPGGRGNNGNVVTDTWDPARKAASTTLSNGNLTLTSGTSSFSDYTMSVGIKSTTGMKAYFEFLITTVGTGASRLGIASGAQTVTGADVNGYVLQNPRDGLVYVSAGSTVAGTAYADGDIMGVRVDWSGGQNNGIVQFYKNNVANGSASGLVLPVALTQTLAFYDVSFTNHVITMRTTSAEFSYSVPSGFTQWASLS